MQPLTLDNMRSLTNQRDRAEDRCRRLENALRLALLTQEDAVQVAGDLWADFQVLANYLAGRDNPARVREVLLRRGKLRELVEEVEEWAEELAEFQW